MTMTTVKNTFYDCQWKLCRRKNAQNFTAEAMTPSLYTPKETNGPAMAMEKVFAPQSGQSAVSRRDCLE